MIQMIQKYNWMGENKTDTPYYHLSKATQSFKNNTILVNLLKEQTNILENEIHKLSPDNGKVWLDLGCGKGKIIPMIKKYNPKKYVGLDIDVKILLNNLHLIDEEDWIKFSPCNVRENWNDTSLWFNISGMKFDYIIMNFSIMHLFDSELFWEQLVNVMKPTTKILCNVVSEKIKDEPFSMLDAYMKYKDTKVIYYFPWCHTEEVNENFISKEEIDTKLKDYSLKVVETNNPTNNKLSIMYDWYHLIRKSNIY
jgi:ubiquinone/menaquinone biosynthesis C-methylase UbiE